VAGGITAPAMGKGMEVRVRKVREYWSVRLCENIHIFVIISDYYGRSALFAVLYLLEEF
jgi:hypothetical protein